MTHAEHAAQHRAATPCAAHHANFGGGCLNCGWEPEDAQQGGSQPLTEQQKAAYLEVRGACCPRCQSDEISGGHVEINDGFAWQNVDCKACGAEWQDVYSLTSVDDVVIYTSTPEVTV